MGRPVLQIIEMKGFLPQAFFNFLTLLGWSSGSEEEFFTKEILETLFSLERVSKSNAVFDIKKLTWMNGQYIRQLNADEFVETVKPFISKEINVIKDAIVSVQGNLEKLSDINDYLAVYVATNVYEGAFNEQELMVIQAFKKHVEKSDVLTKESVLLILEALVEELNLGRGKIFKPIRLAVSAEKSGPNIAELIAVFGKEKVLSRLSRYG